MVASTSEIGITVGGRDVTANVLWKETNFQVNAGAQPGSCQVTLRGPFPDGTTLRAARAGNYRIYGDFTPGIDEIILWVDGVRLWWGYLFMLDQGYVFPDDPEPKVILRGVDLNILFDKLVMYNHANPTWYPDGGGTYQREKVSADNGQVMGYVVTVPSGTWDRDYIQTMLRDFDLDLVKPILRWGQPPYAPSDTRIVPISTINTSDTGAGWTPPSSGTTLRAFFQDVSNNIVRSQPGSAVWYIDPEAYIVWKEQDTDYAFPVGDAAGVTPVRELSVTTDVSRLKNDVLVFTGTLDPTPTSSQSHLLYVHKVNNPSVNLFGRFQYSEVMGSDWLAGMINARANKLLNQEGTPAMRAEFTIFEPGLYPGQIVSIFSDAHTFTVYDPTFGLQTQDHINVPIRSIAMRFRTPGVVEYRVTCSYDTQDPWGLLLALKRPATRGLVRPNFNVIDLTRSPSTYIEATPMVLVKEYPRPSSGGTYQTTYAYIRNSLTVTVQGRRLTSTPDPDTMASAGYLELDPDRGVFKLASGVTGRVYCEYHVWHNLA